MTLAVNGSRFRVAIAPILLGSVQNTTTPAEELGDMVFAAACSPIGEPAWWIT